MVAGRLAQTLCLKMNNKQRIFWIAFIASFLFINEDLIHWLLAIFVENYGIVDGFKDAFKYFTFDGYLFFSVFRVIPYVILFIVIKALIKKKNKNYLGVAWGSLVGILFLITWGSWSSLHSLYTDEHTSSTTAIVFLFLPIYSIVTGLIGGLIGYGISIGINNGKKT